MHHDAGSVFDDGKKQHYYAINGVPPARDSRFPRFKLAEISRFAGAGCYGVHSAIYPVGAAGCPA